MNHRFTIALVGILCVGVTGYSQQTTGGAASGPATVPAQTSTTPASTTTVAPATTTVAPATTTVAPAAPPVVTGPAAAQVTDAKPTAAQMAAAAPVAAADGASYVIGPDDVLTVTVWKETTLTGNVTVRPDGKITLPLVGDVEAAGITPMHLSDDLTAKLKKFITDPTVNVTVVAVNSKRIFMIGEVAHIGPIPVLAGMSPLQAIAVAGGLTPYANSRHIYILRGEQGKQKKIPFDYKKALKSGDMQGITLAPGDTIVVP